MADYIRTVETAERIVYRIGVPTNFIELAKAADAAGKAAHSIADQKNRHLYDDDVMVEADEEEIRFIIVTRDWEVSRV